MDYNNLKFKNRLNYLNKQQKDQITNDSNPE